MPFLILHSLLRSRVGSEEPCPAPQLSPSSSPTFQKCPPITSWSSISATPWTEPEVSRTQLILPVAFATSAKKSLPPAPRYSAPLAITTEWPNASCVVNPATHEASWTPSVLSLTSALAGLPSTASQAH